MSISIDTFNLNKPNLPPQDEFESVIEIRELFVKYPVNASRLHQTLPPSIAKQTIDGFLIVVAPLLHHSFDQISVRFAEIKTKFEATPFTPDGLLDVLSASLPSILASLLNRAMVVELHIAKAMDMLEGETSEARFCSFIQRFYDAETSLAFFAEYPILGERLVQFLAHWVNGQLRFAERLLDNWQAIVRTFRLDCQQSSIIAIDSHLGDVHSGQAVMQLRFECGERLIYKPRSLSVAQKFQNLLKSANDCGFQPQFRLIKMLDCGTHGWSEFITQESCEDAAQLKRFYRRHGGQLALLHTLVANDFHFQNIIAHGEYPILVDYETLFHPIFSEEGIQTSVATIGRAFSSSAIRVGLLPAQPWDRSAKGADFSGLGTKEQHWPHPVPQWEDEGTDKMRIVYRKIRMDDNHQPKLNNECVKLQTYSSDLLAGFEQMYQCILENRAKWLGSNGYIQAFAAEQLRVLIRPTSIYKRLLRDSYHPKFLKDISTQHSHFERLWIGHEKQPYVRKVIDAERHDLLQGDIPIFYHRPNSRHLWTSQGKKIENFLDQTAISLVRDRLAGMNETDLQRQLWWIAASVDGQVMDATKSQQMPSYQFKQHAKNWTVEQLVAESCTVGDKLQRYLYCRNEHTAWFGLKFINTHWQPMHLDVDLYEGSSGIAYYLAYAAKVSGQHRFRHLAETTVNHMLQVIHDDESELQSIGAFQGWGGVIHVLVHLSHLWKQDTLLDLAESLVDKIIDLIPSDQTFDVISGAAGAIVCLLNLAHQRPNSRALEAAINCGDHLIQSATNFPEGLGWISLAASKPLTGFSHGNAGVSWALLKLANETNQTRFYETACQALAYERSLFVEGESNWLDLRFDYQSEHDARFAVAWCHGAPGIGLSRLDNRAIYWDAETERETVAALNTTLASGFGRNHSLCHGDLGNLELLLQFDQASVQFERDRYTAGVLESAAQTGWLTGVPHGFEVPHLMNGLAGIGYQLLRLARPEQVPSILLLEPPKTDPN